MKLGRLYITTNKYQYNYIENKFDIYVRYPKFFIFWKKKDERYIWNTTENSQRILDIEDPATPRNRKISLDK